MSKFGSLGVITDQPARMPIVLPGDVDSLRDEAGQEAYIEFLPWDSEPGRKFDQERQRDIVRKGLRQKSMADLRAEAESVDVIREQVDRLCVLAVGWHLVDVDRSVIDLPFSQANAHDLFAAPEMAWLRRQAWVFVASEANFMRRSSKA